MPQLLGACVCFYCFSPLHTNEHFLRIPQIRTISWSVSHWRAAPRNANAFSLCTKLHVNVNIASERKEHHSEASLIILWFVVVVLVAAAMCHLVCLVCVLLFVPRQSAHKTANLPFNDAKGGCEQLFSQPSATKRRHVSTSTTTMARWRCAARTQTSNALAH